MRKVRWVGGTKKDLMMFPGDVIQEVGYALYLAQNDEHYAKTKRFKGCGSGICEIAIACNTNAYRVIYTVNFDKLLYVLHCFKKKSKRGVKTPKEEVFIIKKRLKWLKEMKNG